MAFLVPESEKTVRGLKIILFPDSVGLAVGFSVIDEADFQKTRTSLGKKLGKSLKKCEIGDKMLSCELEIGEKKTIFLMADEDGNSKKTLIGCYYYYEK